MARRGQFGSRPRVAQSLTSTIVSIEREMQQRRDANLMDAWKNGGEFEGKGVTDAQVEKYWTDREKNLDKKDPLYDTYHDQIMQLQYGIAQSKADLANKQGKLSDGAYANFYLNWSHRVPKNSEFYRTLQKDAAILLENSKAKSANNARKAKLDAFNAFLKNTSDSQINVGNAMLDAVNSMAKESGKNPDADGEEIMSLLSKDIRFNPAKYKALLDALHKQDPHFSGEITTGLFAKEMQRATDGYTAIANRANKDGYQQNYESATKGAAQMATAAADVKVWPVEQAYDVAYQVVAKVWKDANSSELDRSEAMKTFAAVTGRLAGTPGIDPVLKQRLQADATRALGGSAGDTVSLSGVLGRAPLDDSTAVKIKTFADKQTLKDANPGAYVYAPVDANGQFDPSGEGGLGIVPASAVPADAAQVVVVGTSGKPVVASIEPHAVYAINPQDPRDRQRVGSSITYHNGGVTKTYVSAQSADGKYRWTDAADHSPWATGVTSAVDSRGDTYLTSPPPLQTDLLAQAQAIDAAQGTSLAKLITEGKIGASGDVSQSFLDKKDGAKITVSLKNGAFSATRETTQDNGTGNPSTGTRQNYDLNLIEGAKGTAGFAAPWRPGDVVAPSRYQAGVLPGVTFDTTLGASMSTATQAGAQTGQLFNQPEFQQSFLKQAMGSTGATDPLDPRVVSQWQAVTAPKIDQASTAAAVASSRRGLNYPGQTLDKNAANQGSATINFGAQSIKLPNLPSYAGNQNADLSSFADAAGKGIASITQAAQQIAGMLGSAATPTAAAQKPSLGAPAPLAPVMPAPIPTPTPTPGTAPAPVTTPSAAPAAPLGSPQSPSRQRGAL